MFLVPLMLIPEMRAGKCVDAAEPLSPLTADRPRFALIRIRTHSMSVFIGIMDCALINVMILFTQH